MISGTIYIGQTIPITIRVSAGVTVYPVLTVTDPSGNVQDISFSQWVGGASIVDPNVYVSSYTPTEKGAYIYSVNVYSDTNYTQNVTNDRLCGGCGVGSFIAICNPLDETLQAHNNPGSLGEGINQLLSYMLLYEHPGNGSCPYDISVPNGSGVIVKITNMQGELVARDTLDASGKRRFYLEKGQYRIAFIAPCGKKMKDDVKLIKVSCDKGDTCYEV